MVEGVGVASGVYKFLKGLEEKITLYWVLMVANITVYDLAFNFEGSGTRVQCWAHVTAS